MLTKIDNNEVAFIGENYALGIGWREGIDLHYFKLDNSTLCKFSTTIYEKIINELIICERE
ncbi:Undefined function [Listeria monocytogenes]|nr:Undefined function [Listeria monocytogenes]